MRLKREAGADWEGPCVPPWNPWDCGRSEIFIREVTRSVVWKVMSGSTMENSSVVGKRVVRDTA